METRTSSLCFACTYQPMMDPRSFVISNTSPAYTFGPLEKIRVAGRSSVGDGSAARVVVPAMQRRSLREMVKAAFFVGE